MDAYSIKPERPGGFLDFLPADYLAREQMLRTIERVFRSFGFDPVETPRVEFLKTLSGEESDAGKNIFTLNSRNDRETLALPFDHTVPFARLLAANPYDTKTRKGIRLPWRRMVVGPVFRGETPQSGRYRQFYQFDADIAGSASMAADAEIIALMYRTLDALGVQNFEIRLNNRKILNGLAELAGITDRGQVAKEDIVKEMMRTLDRLEKLGTENVLAKLQEPPENEYSLAPNLNEEAVEKIKQYLQLEGSNQTLLLQCAKVFEGIGIAEEGISELREILEYLQAMDIPEEFVRIDFSIARGLDYYTGPVMETFLLNALQFGSVFSGGRFNDLVKRFTGQELPAVGASIGVDRLFAALDSLDLIDRTKQAVADVMVLQLMPNSEKQYLQLASEIRQTKWNVETCLLEDTTFKKQFNFGVSRGVRFLVLYGEDERRRGIVQVRNLETRKQEEVSRENLQEYFRQLKTNDLN